MSKIIKIKNCPNQLSGIYKITFKNGKNYIGFSNNIKRRMKEHLQDSKKSKLPIHKAILKYGLEEFELLEEITNDRELLQQQEKYWIQHYNTFNKEKGYNLTPGGDGASEGIYNNSAKLNKQQLEEIYDLLLNHKELYIYQIAEKFNISSEAISNINTGKHYINKNLTYPLRPPTTFKKGQTINKKGIESNNSKFSKEDLDKVFNLIKNSSLSLQEISKKMNVSYCTISKINRGLVYKKEEETYPLRIKKQSKVKINDEILTLIDKDLADNKISFASLAKKYNVSETTIRRINNGQSRYRENIKYPIRQKY